MSKQEEITTVAEMVEVTPNVETVTFPEGGVQGWLVIFGGFCLAVSTLGFIVSWGTFQEYYEEIVLKSSSSAAIAWIGSLQYALVFLPGLPAGRLFDMGYFRLLMLSATGLFLAANFLIAECHHYWQFLLCQGIALGTASGFLYVPCVTASSQWFDQRRPVALSVVSLGVAIGGIVFPILFRNLLPRIGFQWTIRVMAFINTLLFGIANLTIRPRLPAKGGRADLKSFRGIITVPYMCYVLGTFFCFLGLYTMLTFLGVSAIQIGFSPSIAFYLIAVANANTAVGRLVSGALAVRFGAINIMVLFTLMAGVVTYIWPFVRSHTAFIVLTCLYGISSGAFVGLFPVGVAQLGSIHDLAKRTGLQMSVMSIGAVIGPPISGAIVQSQGTFHGVGIYAGTVVVVAILLMIATKCFALRRIIGGRL